VTEEIDNLKRTEPLKGLLAIDVDGTLITDHGVITETVYSALEKVDRASWEIVIATGRTWYAARQVIESLPFVRLALFSNGACIVNVRESEILHQTTIPRPVAEEVIRTVRANGAIPVLYDSNIYNQSMYYDTMENACEYFIWYLSHDPRGVRVPDIMEHAGDVMQMGMIADSKTIIRIKDALAGHPVAVMSLPFESAHFGGKDHAFRFLQIMERHVSKNNSLKLISGWLGIPPGRIVAVGDNYNDADMIAGADVGVAMGNAPEEIRRLAKVVVASNNDSGLAEVVDTVILSGRFFRED
jgi:Cof subfamily protein (haloacid dehalogenase superfamily)